MLHVAQSVKDPPLLGSQSLPKYEFVQDIEEIPDISIEDTLKNSKAFIMNPVDSFWFFELDTPKTDKKILDLGSTLSLMKDKNLVEDLMEREVDVLMSTNAVTKKS